MRRAFPVLVLLMLFRSSAAAFAAGEISVEADVDRAFITIGDPIEYRVRIRHDSDIALIDSIEGTHLGEFRIKSVKRPAPQQENGKTVVGKTFTITAYRLGRYTIEGLTVRYRDEQGQVKQISTAPLYITVASVDRTRTPESDIRGLKRPWDMTAAWPLAWILAAAFLGAVALYLFGRLRARVPAVSPEDRLGPADWARYRLHALFDSGLLREGKVKEYYFGISGILRAYLEKEFGLSAPELTTREIKQALKDRDWPEAVRTAVIRILEECDMVKFATFEPDPVVLMPFQKKAERLIDTLAEQAEAEQAKRVEDAV